MLQPRPYDALPDDRAAERLTGRCRQLKLALHVRHLPLGEADWLIGFLSARDLLK